MNNKVEFSDLVDASNATRAVEASVQEFAPMEEFTRVDH